MEIEIYYLRLQNQQATYYHLGKSDFGSPRTIELLYNRNKANRLLIYFDVVGKSIRASFYPKEQEDKSRKRHKRSVSYKIIDNHVSINNKQYEFNINRSYEFTQELRSLFIAIAIDITNDCHVHDILYK